MAAAVRLQPHALVHICHVMHRLMIGLAWRAACMRCHFLDEGGAGGLWTAQPRSCPEAQEAMSIHSPSLLSRTLTASQPLLPDCHSAAAMTEHCYVIGIDFGTT